MVVTVLDLVKKIKASQALNVLISIFANYLVPKLVLASVFMIAGMVMMYRINKKEN